jgi:hypothetical protein
MPWTPSCSNLLKDLCRAALEFSFEVLQAGGHFVCKFYQGAEDKDFEKQLRVLFQKVHRLKPESSRSVWSLRISIHNLNILLTLLAGIQGGIFYWPRT